MWCWEEENKEGEGEEDENEELVNPDVMEMDEADWQAWARLRPNNTIPLYDACDVGHRPIDDGWDIDAAHGRWNNINLLSSWIDEQKREALQPEDDTPWIDVNMLEAEQRGGSLNRYHHHGRVPTPGKEIEPPPPTHITTNNISHYC